MAFEIPAAGNSPETAFNRLVGIMHTLRNQCPWDKKQTFESLRHLTIEETYELCDAILEADFEEIKKEIGDVMMHLLFYTEMAKEKGQFDLVQMLNGVCEKLIHRHPHIYSDITVENEQDVKRNWEQLKLKEGNTSVLAGVPKSLPALIKAARIQEKAAGVGFDWENKAQVWEKVEEEMAEFKAEFSASEVDIQKAEEEFGDLLFALVNYARFLKISPENALERTNKKFINRFSFIESQAREAGKSLQNMSLTEMDDLWNEAKKRGM